MLAEDYLARHANLQTHAKNSQTHKTKTNAPRSTHMQDILTNTQDLQSKRYTQTEDKHKLNIQKEGR